MDSKLQQVSQGIANEFNIDDWIGIADGILSAIKKCRESRQNVPENIRSGFLARISMRRELRQTVDDSLSLRQLNRLADRIIEEAQTAQQHEPKEFENFLLQVENFEL